jgi:hypothetical protein
MAKELLTDERVKISFGLNPDEKQAYSAESVWAERIGPDEFRILNSPFFVFGVSAEDIVKVKRDNGGYEFDHVVRKGGHSTYRVFLQGGRSMDGEDFRSRWTPIQALRTTFENADGRLLSVDVPPGVDIVKVYDLLKQGEADGVWVFEEGNYEGTA